MNYNDYKDDPNRVNPPDDYDYFSKFIREISGDDCEPSDDWNAFRGGDMPIYEPMQQWEIDRDLERIKEKNIQIERILNRYREMWGKK